MSTVCDLAINSQPDDETSSNDTNVSETTRSAHIPWVKRRNLRVTKDVQEDTLHVHRPMRVTTSTMRVTMIITARRSMVMSMTLFTVRMTVPLFGVTGTLGQMSMSIRVAMIMLVYSGSARSRRRVDFSVWLEMRSISRSTRL